MLLIRRPSLLRNALFICLLFSPAGLLADTIILKSGERVSGAIVGQSRDAIRISTPRGVRSIPKSEIRSVQFGDSEASEPDPAAEEARRRAAEEARKRREEEERRKIEAEAKRLAEEAYERKREEEARRKAEAEARRQARALKWNQFLVQNAIAPGWGWWEANRRTTGAVYGGLHAALFLRMLDLRRSALAAQDRNEEQVLINTALTLAPLQAATQTRLAFGYFANQQAFGEYQTRIDRYNESWRMLGLVYLIQMAHTFWMRDSYVNAPPENAADGPRARFDFLLGDDAPLGGLQRERRLGVGGSTAPARAEFQASFRF